jgi:hypothetical protein
MDQIQKDGLAIIIKSKAGNEGVIVRTLRPVGVVAYIGGETLDSWECDTGRRLPAFCVNGIRAFHRIRPIPTAYLRPVSGLPEVEDTTTERPVTA